MKHTVTSGGKIKIAPATRTEEILQNVQNIVSTPKGSVPLDRAFGISTEFVDKPLAVSKAMFTAEIVEAVSLYEPRAKVLEVAFEEDENRLVDGRLIPRVEVEIINE